MQTLYVPKYNLHYRVNPRNPRELQWSRKPFGPATQWQHAMSFKNPIRALDLDDETKQGVVVLNDSTTYVGSGVRTWGRKFYPAGTRIYSLYAIGESKMKKLKIKVHESNISKEEILHLPISEYISKHPDKFKIVKEYNWSGLMCIQIFNPYKQEWFFLCDIRQGELLSATGRPYIEVMGVFLDTRDDTITRIKNKDILPNGSVYSYMDTRALYGTKGLDKTWLDALTPSTLEALYTRFTKFFKNVQDYYAKKAESVKHPMPMKIRVHEKDADGVIHNIPLQKRAIKDMLIELNHGGDNKEYNPKDSIQVNKYVHDTAAVTPEWVLQHLGADKSAQIEDLKQNTNLTPIQIASKLDLLDDPVIWMYYDEPTGADVVLIWKSFLE